MGIGLLFHMFTDFVDCLMTLLNVQSCLTVPAAAQLHVSDLFGL
jgi:hypothetical protein